MSGQSHEDFVEYKDVRLPSERSFGWTVGAILIGLCVLRSWLHGAWSTGTTAIAACGVALIVAATVVPGGLAPLNRMWMRLGLLLARITNPVIMAALFGLVFAPYAIVMRARGRDPLRLRRDHATPSYWITRDPPGPSSPSLEQQF